MTKWVNFIDRQGVHQRLPIVAIFHDKDRNGYAVIDRVRGPYDFDQPFAIIALESSCGNEYYGRL